MGNVEKCLAAGFEKVVLVCSDKKRVQTLRKYIESKIEEGNRDKVLFALPEECIAFLDTLAAEPAGSVQTVRGYKVKVNYQAVGESDKKVRREAVGKVILQAMKRMKDKGVDK